MGGGGGGGAPAPPAPVVEKKIECLLQAQGAVLQKYNIPASDALPAGTSELPWPGKKLVVTYRQGAKTIEGGTDHLDGWRNALGDSSRYELRKIGSPSEIPDDADSFWDFIPTNGHTDADKQAISAFLDRGGRVVMVGEHDGYARQANIKISEVSQYLG